jgi:hypothetical protein
MLYHELVSCWIITCSSSKLHVGNICVQTTLLTIGPVVSSSFLRSNSVIENLKWNNFFQILFPLAVLSGLTLAAPRADSSGPSYGPPATDHAGMPYDFAYRWNFLGMITSSNFTSLKTIKLIEITYGIGPASLSRKSFRLFDYN